MLKTAIPLSFVLALAAGVACAAAKKKADDAETLWVARADGSRSCAPGKAASLEDSAAELKKAGVTVLESRKSHDGKMRAAVCGIETGRRNAHRVAKADLEKAQQLGFAEAKVEAEAKPSPAAKRADGY
jgi:hypothetical protein